MIKVETKGQENTRKKVGKATLMPDKLKWG